jgi:hypothetical protein
MCFGFGCYKAFVPPGQAEVFLVLDATKLLSLRDMEALGCPDLIRVHAAARLSLAGEKTQQKIRRKVYYYFAPYYPLRLCVK